MEMKNRLLIGLLLAAQVSGVIAKGDNEDESSFNLVQAAKMEGVKDAGRREQDPEGPEAELRREYDQYLLSAQRQKRPAESFEKWRTLITELKSLGNDSLGSDSHGIAPDRAEKITVNGKTVAVPIEYSSAPEEETEVMAKGSNEDEASVANSNPDANFYRDK